MLERLVGPYETLNAQDKTIQNEDNHLSVASSLNHVNTPTSPQELGISLETEPLQKLIQGPKSQLAVKHNDDLSSELSIETHSTKKSSELKVRSKLKGCMKTMFARKQVK